MIDKEKAIAAVGERGVELYERILDHIRKFVSVGSNGRIGGKLSIMYSIKDRGSMYIDIYKDRADVQLGDGSSQSMSYEKCIVELERFLERVDSEPAPKR